MKRGIRLGADPMSERAAERQAPTVADLCRRYLAEHVAVHMRPTSAAVVRGRIAQLILPKLGTYRLSAVTRADIEAFHRSIPAKVRANRTVATLRGMFNVAIRWNMLDGPNPAAGIKRHHEAPRSRYLSKDELARLMTALAAHPNQQSANVVRLAVLTGARRSEILNATWDQFSDGFAVWNKPHTLTKQRRDHHVPLSASTRLLLSNMHAKSTTEALFPGRGTMATQSSLTRTWKTLCEEAGIHGVRFHDLRHSHASMLASAGMSLATIGALLGHSSPQTAARYAHLTNDALAAATARVGAMVEAASGKAATAVVVPLKNNALSKSA